MLREEVMQVIRELGYERREAPFQLSSGEWSHDYIDGKRAISSGRHLNLVARAVMQMASDEGVSFSAVGGLTMGADPLAHAIALLSETSWFSVRKAPKKHGKQKLIEGALLSAASSVLVVEDVVTTGSSLLQALDAVEEVGAKAVLAVAIVDRGNAAREAIAKRGVKYKPLLTYQDLGIAPVGGS